MIKDYLIRVGFYALGLTVFLSWLFGGFILATWSPIYAAIYLILSISCLLAATD